MKYYLRIGIVGCLTPSPHVIKFPSPWSLVGDFWFASINEPLKFGLVN